MPTELNTESLRQAYAFLEEVLRTGLTLIDLFEHLGEEMETLPDEHPGEVLFEMLAGTITPTVEAAGPDVTREAIALMGATRDATLKDLRAALELARKRE